MTKNGERSRPSCPHSDSCSDVAADTFTLVCKAYLSEQSIDHLATTLRKGGVRDLTAFFPGNKRDDSTLSAYFKAAGVSQVGEWWVKKQSSIARESIIAELKERCERDESPEQVSAAASRHTLL